MRSSFLVERREIPSSGKRFEEGGRQSRADVKDSTSVGNWSGKAIRGHWDWKSLTGN